MSSKAIVGSITVPWRRSSSTTCCALGLPSQFLLAAAFSIASTVALQKVTIELALAPAGGLPCAARAPRAHGRR